MLIINLPEHDIEKYQNELISIAIDGSRKWIYPRQLLLSLSCLQQEVCLWAFYISPILPSTINIKNHHTGQNSIFSYSLNGDFRCSEIIQKLLRLP